MKLAGELRTRAVALTGRRASSNKKRILDGAAACEELVSKPYRCPKCGMEHPVWDDEPDTRHAREVTIWAAAECRRLFGSTMYNTVASIVSAILGRTIKRASVREWVPQTVR
jgi:ribosomal protein L37AE/L43A